MQGRYKLESPNPDFAGLRFGVQFEGGIGHTDSLQVAKAICEPQYAGQEKFFKLTDTQEGRQLFPVIDQPDPTQDDGTK